MTSKHPILTTLMRITIIGLVLTACSPAPLPATTSVPTTSNDSPPPAAATQTAENATSQPAQPSVWIDPHLPSGLRADFALPDGWQLASSATAADFALTWGAGRPVTRWVYALVAPFPTLQDDVGFDDLDSLWQGQKSSLVSADVLLVAPETQAALTPVLGQPGKTVQVLSGDELLDQTWSRHNTWAIVPFEDLEPRWKVIQVDTQSPIHKDFLPLQYPLTAPISLNAGSTAPQALDAAVAALDLPASNRDADKLTTLVLTGTTALVRGVAGLMESKGMTYPDQQIRQWLVDADITHVSNEVAFTPRCPQPFDRENNLVFCSQPEYIRLLEDIGTDVVELDGDHFQDWGPEAIQYSMDLYDEEGWGTYGGGRNLAEGRRPWLVEDHGNKLAFLGCNAKAQGYATASDTQPGAVYCDFDWLLPEIKRLKNDGYLPIVTFQHLEYYSYSAHPILQEDFRQAAKAGAVIISGSQAHQPQAMEFSGASFLHYGLGNLFFDQYFEGIPLRQAFIDRHVFYNGQYLSTELLTIQFVDLAQPRPMTPDEHNDLLSIIFDASGW
ncbi:MAG: hypothetical protein GYA17_09380 [Chloroflexi bacterium]|nr:hypothetical protein [Chloroflexota bacterium]